MAEQRYFALQEVGPLEEKRDPHTIYFASEERLIGRGSGAYLQIRRSVVSRQHASIQLDERGALIICDVGSTHGTFLNGRRLEPHRKEQLRVGDRIIFGRDQLFAVVEMDAKGAQLSARRPLPSEPVRQGPPTPTRTHQPTGSLMDLALTDQPVDHRVSDYLYELAGFTMTPAVATAKELLTKAVEVMAPMGGDRRFGLIGDGADFRVVAIAGVDGRDDPALLVPNEAIVARALDSIDPVVVFDGQTDNSIAEADRSPRLRSAICISVQIGERVGALYADAQQSGLFGAFEAYFVQLLAAVISAKATKLSPPSTNEAAAQKELPPELRKRLDSHLNRLEMIADDAEHEGGQAAIAQLIHAEVKRLRAAIEQCG